jgi:hypothetical protein
VVAALSAAAWFALEAGRRHAAGASRPAHEQARSVAASYHNAPLSYEMAGHLDYLGGGPLKALLILLPSEPGAAR